MNWQTSSPIQGQSWWGMSARGTPPGVHSWKYYPMVALKASWPFLEERDSFSEPHQVALRSDFHHGSCFHVNLALSVVGGVGGPGGFTLLPQFNIQDISIPCPFQVCLWPTPIPFPAIACQNSLCCILWWGVLIGRLGKGKRKHCSISLEITSGSPQYLNQIFSWHKETNGMYQMTPERITSGANRSYWVPPPPTSNIPPAHTPWSIPPLPPTQPTSQHLWNFSSPPHKVSSLPSTVVVAQKQGATCSFGLVFTVP